MFLIIGSNIEFPSIENNLRKPGPVEAILLHNGPQMRVPQMAYRTLQSHPHPPLLHLLWLAKEPQYRIRKLLTSMQTIDYFTF